MNTTTQTVDERCAEMAAQAMLHCRQAGRALVKGGYRNLRFCCFPMPHDVAQTVTEHANRIIALRTAEAAQKPCRCSDEYECDHCVAVSL